MREEVDVETHVCAIFVMVQRERELESVEIEIEDDEIGAALSAKMKAHGGSLSLQGRVLEQATPLCHIIHRKCPNHILLRIGP